VNAKDRAVQQHLVRAVLAAQNDVPPELLDLIGGSTPEEIDRSVERVKATTAQLVSRVRQEAVRPSDTDPAWQFNQSQGYGDQQPLTADQIGAMDMRQFSELRQQLGIGASHSTSSTLEFLEDRDDRQLR
jgi:hypothetical protein